MQVDRPVHKETGRLSPPHIITTQRKELRHVLDTKKPPIINMRRFRPPCVFGLSNPATVFFGCQEMMPDPGVVVKEKPS